MLSRRIALFTLAAVALSGCATFDNNDVVAKVGDVELSTAELERRVERRGLVVDGRIAGDAARTTIASWVGSQLAERADILDAYSQGPDTSGIACFQFAPVPDAPTADAVKDDLDNGASIDDVVAEFAPQVAGENQACVPVIGLGGDPTQLAGMSDSDPHRVFVQDTGATFVFRLQNADELDGLSLLFAAAAVEPGLADELVADAEVADIEVAPRYGTFDTATFAVVPIG